MRGTYVMNQCTYFTWWNTFSRSLSVCLYHSLSLWISVQISLDRPPPLSGVVVFKSHKRPVQRPDVINVRWVSVCAYMWTYACMCAYVGRTYACMCAYVGHHIRHQKFPKNQYGVAMISRLLQNLGVFCRIMSLLWGSFAKETYVFRELIVATS